MAGADLHAVLRAGTAAAHARVDALFGGFDLASARGYRAFLHAHARAFIPVEAALDGTGVAAIVPDWPERRRAGALIADLAELGGSAVPGEPFAIADEAGAIGALYVLEGSRLGGSLLKRQVPAALPARYLGAPAAPGSWRKLLALLATIEYGAAERMSAVAGARSVFARFETAALEQLEHVGS